MSTRTLPLFPLSTVLFPGGPLALRIFEPRYVAMVSRCMRESTGFGVVLLVEGLEAGVGAMTTAATGTEAQIVDFNRLEDGLLGLTCVGRERLRILRAWRQDDRLNLAEVEDLPRRTASTCAPCPTTARTLAHALRRLYPDLEPIYDPGSRRAGTMPAGSATAWRNSRRWSRPSSRDCSSSATRSSG